MAHTFIRSFTTHFTFYFGFLPTKIRGGVIGVFVLLMIIDLFMIQERRKGKEWIIFGWEYPVLHTARPTASVAVLREGERERNYTYYIILYSLFLLK